MKNLLATFVTLFSLTVLLFIPVKVFASPCPEKVSASVFCSYGKGSLVFKSHTGSFQLSDWYAYDANEYCFNCPGIDLRLKCEYSPLTWKNQYFLKTTKTTNEERTVENAKDLKSMALSLDELKPMTWEDITEPKVELDYKIKANIFGKIKKSDRKDYIWTGMGSVRESDKSLIFDLDTASSGVGIYHYYYLGESCSEEIILE